MTADPRRLAGAALAEAMRDSRATTLARVGDRSDADWRVPEQAGVNPVAWELGHLAWFGEFWILRGPHALGADGLVSASRPARIAGPDAVFDSARLPHGERWHTPLPGARGPARASRRATRRVHRGDPRRHRATTARTTSIASLCSTRTCTVKRSPGCARPSAGRHRPGLAEPARGAAPTALAFAGGSIEIGRPEAAPGFGFDNESPPRRVELAPFEIDSAPVRAGAVPRASSKPAVTTTPPSGPARPARGARAQPLAHPQRWRRSGAGALADALVRPLAAARPGARRSST